MELGPGICRQPDDVTGIWWDLRCEQNNMNISHPSCMMKIRPASLRSVGAFDKPLTASADCHGNRQIGQISQFVLPTCPNGVIRHRPGSAKNMRLTSVFITFVLI